MEDKRKQTSEGITLIALIVTIIILIILAGVSIHMIVGDNGIITQAQKAKTDTDEVALKEKLDRIALEREINRALSSTIEEDETDVFLEMMGDKEITQEDIQSFNETLQSYGKQLTAINNESDIQKIGTNENYPLDGLYVLLEDVSMNGETWIPIGTEEEPFTGSFNGNNKTINGLTLTNPEMNAGLFGVNSGSIKNLQVTNVSIVSEQDKIGVIVGQNNGLVENCHVQSGTISIKGSFGTGSTVGGVCGRNNDGGIIQNSSNASTVTGEHKLVGGICGYNIGGDILNCENRGEIHGTYQVGGIAGDFYYIIRNCENKGTIKNTATIAAKARYIGGIAGADMGDIIETTNSGNIEITTSTVGNYVGGIAGYMQKGINTGFDKIKIEKCSNIGTVNGYQYVGGIAGIVAEEATINSSFNLGDVTGTTYVGGAVGYVLETATIIENLYNKGQVSGSTNYVGGLVGMMRSGMENVYNTGDVSINSNTTLGGIIGNLDTTKVSIEEIKNCYYLDTSCEKAIGNEISIDTVKSKNTEEMKALSTTLGEAFKNSTEGDGYPKLSWE